MQNEFLKKGNETFYYWECFKDLLNSCPHHGYESWHTINFFYEGLMPQIRQFIEMMCNGEFLNKEPNEAWQYFEQLAGNANLGTPLPLLQIQVRPSLPPHLVGVGITLRKEDDVNAKISSLARKVEAMKLKKVNEIKFLQKDEIFGICEIMGHVTHECPTVHAFKEVLHDLANAMNTSISNFHILRHIIKNHHNFS